MLRNQKGFVYPITLCLIILLSTVLVIRIEHFLTEKRMLQETEIIVKQDYYLLSAMERLQFYLSTNADMSINDSFDFKDGVVSYHIIELTEELSDIIITIKMEEHDTVFNGNAIYDRNLKKIIKWKEIN